MFNDGWFSDPVSIGWLLLAGVGLVLLLALASWMNRDPLEGRPYEFRGTEPGPEDRPEAPGYGLNAEEVEERDRRS